MTHLDLSCTLQNTQILVCPDARHIIGRGDGFGSAHQQVIHGLEVPTDDITSPTFDETKHHQYRFWRGKDWAPYAQGGIHAQEATFDGVPIYLEDEDGHTVYTQLLSTTDGILRLIKFIEAFGAFRKRSQGHNTLEEEKQEDQGTSG